MKTDARFEDVFQLQLENLYDAEKQIVKALPKMIAQASSEELAEALQEHLDQTKEQVTRLEVIFGRMGEEPGARKCEGIEGLIGEGEKSIADLKKSPALDITLIAVAQKVEHYEIASYGTACAIAEILGQQDAFDLLQTTLEEEINADESLSDIADAIITGDAAGAEGELMIEDEELDEEELDEEEASGHSHAMRMPKGTDYE